jgi:hypothetical protein
MVRVNGKEMIFGTWFTLANEGNAVIDVPQFPAIHFTILPWDGETWSWSENQKDLVDRMNWEQVIEVKIDQQMRISAPYLLEHKTHTQDFTIDLPSVGKFTCQLIRQQVSGTMLVHIAIYRDA